MVTQVFRSGLSWAGLAVAPAAWAMSTQLNYALVPLQCAGQWSAIPAISLLLALLALLGGRWSWQAWLRGGASSKEERTVDTERFVAAVAVLLSALFALTILMQMAASLVLDSCMR